MEAHNSAWVPGNHRTAPGVTDEHGDLVAAMRTFGEAFTARQAGQVARGQDLMTEASNVLGSAGIHLVLALLKARRGGRCSCPSSCATIRTSRCT